MSSLITERPLMLSPSLAATIGLEEAILLPILCDYYWITHHQPKTQPVSICCNKLMELLPFWSPSTLKTISQRLHDQGIITLTSPPSLPDGILSFTINEGVFSHIDHVSPTPALAKPLANPSVNTVASQARPLPPHWQPDEELLQLLELNHQIPRDFTREQLEDFRCYWQDRQEVAHSWSNKYRQHVLKAWRHQQSRAAQSDSEGLISTDWQPSEDALDILHRADINAAFIEDAIPEFVLYWRERRDTSGLWSSKFISHIKRQWAQYTQTLESDYEPKPLAANWQPSEEVFDVLRLATIDTDFAHTLIPEFVLFWRDTKAAHRSWNTKFLQHVKYHWALRHTNKNHQRGIDHASQPGDHQPGQAKDGSLIKRLTDRSWAQGIVEGV